VERLQRVELPQPQVGLCHTGPASFCEVAGGAQSLSVHDICCPATAVWGDVIPVPSGFELSPASSAPAIGREVHRGTLAGVEPARHAARSLASRSTLARSNM